MERMIRALLLWATLPFVYWKATLAVAILATCCIFCNYTKGQPDPCRDVPMLIVNDLTAAFKTGIDKHQQNRYIVIHHTASNGENLISSIVRKHLGENQWSKIGYHYFIDSQNQVWQFLPENEAAPNAYHRNNDAVAICIAGNFSERQVPDSILNTAADLCKIIMARNNITADNVVRHRDVPDNATECCGNYFNIIEFRKKLF